MGCEGFDDVEQGESTAARDAEGDEPTMRTRIEVMFGYVSQWHLLWRENQSLEATAVLSRLYLFGSSQVTL